MSLKTAALRVLERNSTRNSASTESSNSRNFVTTDIPEVFSRSEIGSDLLKVLTHACKDLLISPSDVQQALKEKGIEDWRNKIISNEALSAFALSLVQRRDIDLGIRPALYTKPSNCKNCGPVWLWFTGGVLGCPWCGNRASGKPIPRPSCIQCGKCTHFKRIKHPHGISASPVAASVNHWIIFCPDHARHNMNNRIPLQQGPDVLRLCIYINTQYR